MECELMTEIYKVTGNIGIIGSKESIIAFLNLSTIMKSGRFGIDIQMSDEIRKLIHNMDTSQQAVNLPFSGINRKKFKDTARNMMTDILDERKTTQNGHRETWGPDWTIEQEESYQTLKEEPVKLVLEYVQSESGIQTLSDERFVLTMNPENIEELIIESEWISSIEYDEKNIVDMFENYALSSSINNSDPTGWSVNESPNYSPAKKAIKIHQVVNEWLKNRNIHQAIESDVTK